MNMNFEKLIDQVNQSVRKNIIYSQELIEKFDLSLPFDNENYSYLTNKTGGEGYFPWLNGLVRETKAKLIVELGNRYGCSTISIFSGMSSDQKLISVDLVEDQRYLPDQIYNSDQVELIIGDCLDLSIYDDVPIDIDILWSDTEHTYDQILKEFQIYRYLLADKSIIVIDDIFLNDKKKFYDLWQGAKVELSQICHFNGFAVLQYLSEYSHLDRKFRIQQATRESMKILSEQKWDLHKRVDTMHEKYFFVGGKDKLKRYYRSFIPKIIQDCVTKLRNKYT